jgi:hypothetical protein
MGGGESSDADERTERAARHGRPITEEQRKNGKKATVSSSAKSSLEKLWHRLRANQRNVRRSAGKARPDGRAFTDYLRREERLERVSINLNSSHSSSLKKSTPILIKVSPLQISQGV